ncbi:hypothetical protein GUJ93_ZPchr0006g43038 [Zizania palustris]|uniref:Chromo domain-containing protein n=1 Tax=Zizania palustris TaxID=103762 RepID=A0A8J5W462_ZIZPA|nr:hypothetical protein GUJ93_ZPchr0006g43038 [Zizania palustris]
MKLQADKKRSFRVFAVGDWVYVKLQPYVQISLKRRANHKLTFKYFGPFRVSAKLGSVAYRLQLPSNSNIHPVFHVSQLRGAPSGVVTEQDQATKPSPDQAPDRILDYRTNEDQPNPGIQVLVQWQNKSAEEATWEDMELLRKKFPQTLAWGQANFQGRAIVSDQGGMPMPELLPDALQHEEDAAKPAARVRKPSLTLPPAVPFRLPQFSSFSSPNRSDGARGLGGVASATAGQLPFSLPCRCVRLAEGAAVAGERAVGKATPPRRCVSDVGLPIRSPALPILIPHHSAHTSKSLRWSARFG